MHPEGLNSVPLLTQNKTPLTIGKSRTSLNKKRSRRSIISYNGNYEGDISMFQDNKPFELVQLNLVDTDSDDAELKRESSFYSLGTRRGSKKISLVCRLLQFLNPEMREQVSAHIHNFKESHLFTAFSRWSKYTSEMFILGYYLITFLFTPLAALFSFFWRQRVTFHNLSRRLLWRLTLAKCNDCTLFVLILLSIPALIILSLMGFISSICGYLKDAISKWQSKFNYKKIK